MVVEGKITKVEDIEVVLDDLDETSITSILKKWNEINIIKKKLEQLDDMLKIKVKNFLKERMWDRYNDKDTKINVSIISEKRESFDKTQLKLMLNDAQYAQVIKTTTFEKMLITTPESRENIKKFVKK